MLDASSAEDNVDSFQGGMSNPNASFGKQIRTALQKNFKKL